jgi:hypothetical protein
VSIRYTYDEEKKRFTPVENNEIPVWEVSVVAVAFVLGLQAFGRRTV